jgi:hypothetical protein
MTVSASLAVDEKQPYKDMSIFNRKHHRRQSGKGYSMDNKKFEEHSKGIG